MLYVYIVCNSFLWNIEIEVVDDSIDETEELVESEFEKPNAEEIEEQEYEELEDYDVEDVNEFEELEDFEEEDLGAESESEPEVKPDPEIDLDPGNDQEVEKEIGLEFEMEPMSEDESWIKVLLCKFKKGCASKIDLRQSRSLTLGHRTQGHAVTISNRY